MELSGAKRPVLLVVDDEEAVRYSFRRMMAKEPFSVETLSGGKEALKRVQEGGVSVIVLDVRLGSEMDGHQTLQEIKRIDPKISVILVTAYASANTAIEATRHGAYDYVLKPFDPGDMRTLIQRAYQAHEAMSRAVRLGEEDEPSVGAEEDCIIGMSPPMQEIYKTIGRIANSCEPVLIRGESGTGKELVARAIYQFSGRKTGLFLPVNCGAIPEPLLESEFFGHEKGSFTGAHERKIGKLEQADGGTVLLDEIGEMPLDTQVKLLRFLEDHQVTRVGSASGREVDVRVLAATNRNLEEMISRGAFREDLYYRLDVVSVVLPPLRKRREDIPLLARYFLKKHARENGTDPPAILPEALAAMEAYDWPGNVRELANTIRRVLVQCRGHAITPDDLGLGAVAAARSARVAGKPMEQELATLLSESLSRSYRELSGTGDCIPVLPEIERILVYHAMKLTRGNQVKASKILGMSRNTLRKRIQAEKGSEVADRASVPNQRDIPPFV